MGFFIGIDPDADKSGVAVWDSKSKNLIEVTSLKFFELLGFLRAFDMKSSPVKVILEAGWLHKKSNWHNEKIGARVASRIGTNVGANHQCGKLIAEMCEYLKIPFTLVPPQGKMNSENFSRITGIKKSNQDLRDAVLLVWGR